MRHYESGQFTAADHISKRGNAMACKILYRIIDQIASAIRYHHCHIRTTTRKRKNLLRAEALRRLRSQLSIN